MSLSQISSLQRKLETLEARLQTGRVEIPVVPDSMLEFAKQFRMVNKRPFSFDYVDAKTGQTIEGARKYLYDIYSTVPDRLIITKGRQMEITEYAVNYVLWHALKYQGCTIIYTSPRQDQVSRFSKRRLRRLGVYDSPLLRGLLTEEPSVHELDIGDSVVYAYSAWGDADALRNIPADLAVLDEVQDIPNLADTLPVIEENLAHGTITPTLDRMLLIGTPKNAGEAFDNLWRMSSQKEWDADKGVWVAKQPPDPWEGYHVSQMMAPWIPRSKIEYKRRFYTRARFENEVLGLFFKGAGRPLTPDDMANITDNSLGFENGVDPASGRFIYSSSDWGTGKNSNTVFLALEAVEHQPDPPLFKIVYIENVSATCPDPLSEIERTAILIQRYNSRIHVADIGFGYTQVSELRKTFGNRVLGCDYKGSIKEPLKHVQSAYGPVLQADRGVYIDKVIDLIKRGRERIVLPGADYDKREWFWSNVICLYLEAEETAHGRRYKRWEHDRDSQDDLFQSLVYALIAYEVDAPSRLAGAEVVGYGGPIDSVVDFG